MFARPGRRSLLLGTMSHVLAAVAWPYANGPRHIGHVSGFGVPSDVFQPVHADVRPRCAHGLGHRRARHADPGAGRRGRRHAPRARRPLQPGDRRGPVRPRALLRPVHPDHHPQPLRGRAGAVHRPLRERLHRPQDHAGRDLPVDRAHAAGPLHRGHLPHLRLRERPWRPVRQLRQPARPRAADQPALADQRRDAAVRGDRALLPRPAGLRPVAGQVAGRARGLAPQRAEVLPQPARRPPAPCHHPRPRVGHPDPARRLAGPRRQAHLRVVRRGHRLPVGVDRVGPPLRRPGGVAAVVVGRRAGQGRARLLLHGQGQHRPSTR